MTSEDQEKSRRELEDLFNYNPPPFQKAENLPEYRLPFTFFDRHIDSRLSLQRVVLLPSFSREVADVVDQEIQVLVNEKNQLPLICYDHEFNEGCALPIRSERRYRSYREQLKDAASVARFYAQVSFHYCSAVGSTLGLHPGTHIWLSVFTFSKVGEEADEGRSAMTNQYHLKIRRNFDNGDMSVPKGIWKCLDDGARVNLSELFKRFRTLASYQFFAAREEYENLLENMSVMASEGSFIPLPSRVSAAQPEESSLPVTVDAPITLLGLPQEQLKSTSAFTAQSQHHEDKGTSDVTIQTSKCDKHDKADINSFVQHAWTQSVIDDTTFIIFSCGRYERIGVRHRESRTLFISDLIDVRGCRNPGYGKIQAGIYLLIIRDAMIRVSQLMKLEKIPVREAVTSVVDTKDGRKDMKRRKTRSVMASVEKEKALFLGECAKRDLVLLRIRHGPFNSPSPVAFMRWTHDPASGSTSEERRSKSGASTRQYQPHEYIELELTPGYESGATGQVHKTILRLTLSDGKVLSRPVIVKIAFHQYQRERLRHEHVVYSYMVTKRVKCIPTTFGFFEDMENESSIFIMADVGISLHNRELRRKPGVKFVEDVSVTREERLVPLLPKFRIIHVMPREAFKKALSEIHDAGIRHYDIRPMNLMVDEEGSATIIDFDMAKIGAGKHSRKREYDDLCLLLSGRYVPPNQIPSAATTQSARADSDILQDI